MREFIISSKLEPCPCCGSRHVETCAGFWGGAAPFGSEFTDEVMCDDCGLVAPSIEAWNRRAEAEALKDRIERLEEIVGELWPWSPYGFEDEYRERLEALGFVLDEEEEL